MLGFLFFDDVCFTDNKDSVVSVPITWKEACNREMEDVTVPQPMTARLTQNEPRANFFSRQSHEAGNIKSQANNENGENARKMGKHFFNHSKKKKDKKKLTNTNQS